MNRNDDLCLPGFSGGMEEPRIRTMEEINAWIEQDYREFFNRQEYENEKLRLSVEKRFRL